MAAVIGVSVVVLAIGYVIYRRFRVTTQRLSFEKPQDQISGLVAKIREDEIVDMYLLYQDGTANRVICNEEREGRP